MILMVNGFGKPNITGSDSGKHTKLECYCNHHCLIVFLLPYVYYIKEYNKPYYRISFLPLFSWIHAGLTELWWSTFHPIGICDPGPQNQS